MCLSIISWVITDQQSIDFLLRREWDPVHLLTPNSCCGLKSHTTMGSARAGCMTVYVESVISYRTLKAWSMDEFLLVQSESWWAAQILSHTSQTHPRINAFIGCDGLLMKLIPFFFRSSIFKLNSLKRGPKNEGIVCYSWTRCNVRTRRLPVLTYPFQQ